MEKIKSFKKIKKIIGVFGYGSQGRAHALNLRDSGYKVLVANINDEYSKLAKKDKFKVHTFEYVSKNAEIRRLKNSKGSVSMFCRVKPTSFLLNLLWLLPANGLMDCAVKKYWFAGLQQVNSMIEFAYRLDLIKR